jgi:hypothetical protein
MKEIKVTNWRLWIPLFGILYVVYLFIYYPSSYVTGKTYLFVLLIPWLSIGVLSPFILMYYL